ncbi:hypothetical protein [Gaetbulibacter aestuarii]|uniref:Uncharacterized protein n=1 Tax=Gaetbulibacter aestuarii TaxID=1502358 RepID=A0ABW7MU21_9FLAO
METKEMAIVNATQTQENIQLVDGTFTGPEASNIITNLINEKINFHKIQRLQKWEDDHSVNTSDLDDRIHQLRKEKEKALNFINSQKDTKTRFKINGILEITAEE